MFVYMIENQETGKIYIGKTVTKDLEKYLQNKLATARDGYEGRSHLLASMKKHLPFVWRIFPLISSLKTNEELCFWEKVLIAEYDAQNPDVGYNILPGELRLGPAWNKGLKTGHAPWRGKKRSLASVEKGVATKRRNGTTIPLGWNQDSEVNATRVATRKERGTYGRHRKGKKHSFETIALMRAKALGNTNRLGKRLLDSSLDCGD